ncbi:MAG: hypothetical protein P4L79_16985 [Legionella sp.]|uniref:hypothetical protein n=1 Tax=Legionella sp. TaxID=459 RepID=UPI002840D030|nr:hypothetical protein [Legionella sp.]
MGNIISTFFTNSPVKQTAVTLIQFLKAEPQISEINAFSHRLEVLRKDLTHAKTTDAIVSITHQMIDLQRQVRSYLETKKAELQITVDAEVENKLSQLLGLQDNASIKILFAYTDMAAKSINEAAEQIVIEEMYSSLSEEKRVDAKKFINSLNALQNVAQQMIIKYKEFAVLLESAGDMEEIYFIEQRIEALNSSLVKEFPKLVDIPKDQETLRAVLSTVNQNQSLRDILMAFKPQDVLSNDILNARAEATSNPTLRHSI